MKNEIQPATLTVELSPIQQSAIATIAKKLRVKPEDAFKVLAFMPVHTRFDMELFREEFEDVLEAVLAGELPSLADEQLAGCIEFEQATAEVAHV